MPGVVISTSVRTGPSSATVRESSQLFVVGEAERGPSDEPILVESLVDFEAVFGGYVSGTYLHPTIETFFEEGGTRAYIGRVVGPAATVGELTLLSASAADVITLTANGAGAWSADLSVVVTQPTPGSTFKVNLYYEDELVYSTGTVSSAAQAVGRINSSTVAAQYVTAAVDNDALIPATLGDTNFSAGSADSASITDAMYVTALELFNDSLGSGAVTCPESSTTEVRNGLVAHANAYSRIALLFGGETDSVSTIKATAVDVQTENNAEHAAIYYPWVEVPTSTAGVTRFIPPVGYVAGKRAIAHNTKGAHLPAAGLLSVAKFVVGLKTDINKTVGDDLDENYVNAIRVIQNTIRIYGARSCSSDITNFRYITQQDVVNTIVTECYRSIEDVVFSTIDGRNTVFADIESRLIAVLASVEATGALYPAFTPAGVLIDRGWTAKCNPSLNPSSQLATGLVKASVGVRVSSIGDKIEIDIVKSNLTSSVV